ncbi:peptidylprolyl isomerase [Chroococcidiopsis sp [FACHB-1243]]|uniref:peptidylprolyl isomerase n=1 Tax=Chroococcidiopsis sp. [FACHB-1243] TaxID=2692781 RepID=UPI00321FF33D
MVVFMNPAPHSVDFFGLSIEFAEIVSYLQKNLQLKEVCQQILYRRIIERVARERGLTVEAEEIQAELERQRRDRDLEIDADLLTWLTDRLLDRETWEASIRDRLLAEKLNQRLFAIEVERFFNQHPSEFERVLLYRIVVSSAAEALEILYRLQEGQISFYEAAHFYDISEKRRLQCGYEGRIYRSQLQPDIAAIVFSGAVGQAIGPLQTDTGYCLLLVEEFFSAQLTSERFQEILERLFQRWLALELSSMLQGK